MLVWLVLDLFSNLLLSNPLLWILNYFLRNGVMQHDYCGKTGNHISVLLQNLFQAKNVLLARNVRNFEKQPEIMMSQISHACNVIDMWRRSKRNNCN